MDYVDVIKWWVTHAATEHEVAEIKETIKIFEGGKHQ